MKLHHTTFALVAGFATFFGASGIASAVDLQTVVSTIYQVGSGSAVSIGHTAVASTSFNRLYAGGTFSASCGGPGVVPLTGQRFETGEALLGGVRMAITIPRDRPAIVNMPGYYEAATRGQTLQCAYNWTSRAVEGSFSVGIGGVGITIGGGEKNDGGTTNFSMRVPAQSDVNDNAACIP